MKDIELKLKRTENELKRYKKAYKFYMDYFDCLDDDLKEDLDKKLKTIDL
jgi:hypothetical protein